MVVYLASVGNRVADGVFPELAQSVVNGVERLVELGAQREQLQLHVEVENKFEVERNVDEGVEQTQGLSGGPGNDPAQGHHQSDHGQQRGEEDRVVVLGHLVAFHPALCRHLWQSQISLSLEHVTYKIQSSETRKIFKKILTF